MQQTTTPTWKYLQQACTDTEKSIQSQKYKVL